MKALLVLVTFFISSVSFAEGDVVVTCKQEAEVYQLVVKHSDDRSGLREASLYYKPLQQHINLYRYEFEPAVIDDKLICKTKSTSPIIISCHSNRTYEHSIPKAGIVNEPKSFEAMFEIKHTKTEENSVVGISTTEFSTMRYKVNVDFVTRIKPIELTAINLSDDNKQEKLYLDIRQLDLTGECSIN